MTSAMPIARASLVVLLVNAAWCRADLITHYDTTALTPVANGTPVLTLPDLSGHGNGAAKSTTAATVGTYVNNGIGGRAAIQFVSDGASSSVGFGHGYQSSLNGSAFGLTGDASFTQIFVFRTPGNTTNIYSWVGSVGDGFADHGSAIVELDGQRLDIATGGGNDAALNPSNSFNQLANRNLILTVTHQGGTGNPIGSTFQLHANGDAPGLGILAGLSLGTTGDANAEALDLADAPFVLGGGPVGTGSGFDGLISEAFFYNTALTSQERQSVEYMLGQKYGIPVSSVPEPSSVALCGVAAFGLLQRWRRRRTAR